ncbi:activity-dependent neuroprotector homeobox protein 2b [Conger conger]|uniref:activity-dependent neuroprotector homeobox protein 2b n=1 Tax=Conger conger TaxID=82655 RepID=UPI002A5A7020|nr:activity-dependent neuroprotector homeobox protein 2b [Conger conger]
MYQIPVGNLDRIRRSRKKVKHILSEIGLENCKDLLGDLESFDAGEKTFHNTDWADFTEGHNGKRRKKWRYRTQTLCCSLCKFSARSWHTYKSHVLRCHEEEQELSLLSVCSCCSFVAHPRLISRHFRIFHGGLPKASGFAAPPLMSQTPVGPLPPAANSTERYSCRRCSYHDTLIYCMKKHVLVTHYVSLLNHYFGQRADIDQRAKGLNSFRFYCKMCFLAAENSEHLLYHILSSDKHKEVDAHINGLIYEHGKVTKKYLPNLAPKTVQSHVYNSPLISRNGDQQPGKPLSLQRPDASPVSGGPLSATLLHGSPHNTAALCTSGSSQTFLPAQASALVQLASAEAKGRLRPSSAVAALHNTQPPRGISATLPTSGGLATPMIQAPTGTALANVSHNPPKPPPIAAGLPTQPPLQQQPHLQLQQQPHLQQQLQQQPQQPRQVFLPPGVQVNVPGNLGLRGPTAQPLLLNPRLPLSQPAPRGTMMTSQSLLSHLIPTGNKVNGLPTYTLAPLQVGMQVPTSSLPVVSKGPVPAAQVNTTALTQTSKPTGVSVTDPPTASKQAKKWITCPVCNELFPSDVYQVHTEVAHKVPTKAARQKGLAARAPFLKKMPDKTVKCLMCKVLLSEKGLFEHLLHGLNCLYCQGIFYSIKQLMEHTSTEHSSLKKANCDFMRREYRLYSDDYGNLLFPYFDINTTVPKELIGDKELNFALVTSSLDLIFLKMFPGSAESVSRPSITKTGITVCPFCPEKLHGVESYNMHLKEKHYIIPTIHAILKTPAFKCIYCSGVYTGKITPKAISIHVQRCRCRPTKNAEKVINPDPNGQSVPAVNRDEQRPPLFPPTKQAPPPAPAHKTAREEAELHSKQRLEIAVREAVEANKREREARTVKRRKVEVPKSTTHPAVQTPVQHDPPVSLLLDPTGMEMRSFEERRGFVTDYFHKKPYLSKKECEVLANRLWLNKIDVSCHFAIKRNKCLRAIQRNRTAVLLGFNMAELKKVKHDLLIPETESEKTAA